MISVLLVDDEPDLLEVAKLHLEQSGSFSVDTCDSAERALSSIGNKRYDAIIADYNMPVMSGLDLLKELKSQGNSTPFIMLTASSHEDVVVDALNAGAMFYLRKGQNLDAPFSDLSHKLHLAVRRHQSDRNMHLFSAISRHDLLNKVSALFGYVDLIKSRTDDTKILDYAAKQHMILKIIRDQIEFISDYEQLGTQKPFWQPLDAAIRNASTLLPVDLVTLTLTDIDALDIYADPLLMKAFYNLMDNTLRHGRHVTSVRVSGRVTEDGLVISYEDNGMGILPEDKERVFGRGAGKNTGLGLFLIREIFAMTGITIHETGVYGEGVRFEITVPPENYRTAVPSEIYS